MDIEVMKFNDIDLEMISVIWNEIIDEGLNFFWKEHFSKEEIKKILSTQDAVYCASYEGNTIGFYILHANFPGRGNHIANALYGVKKQYRGKGIGKILAKHSIKLARELGYEAMQYNSVVSTNEASVKLWESLDFERVGQISEAFKTNNNEKIEIYIYHKKL